MKQLRLVTVVVLAAVIVGLLGGAVLAAGNGPDTAVAPATDWQPLRIGERAWYAFNYAGDKSQVEVKLEAEPGNAANFYVWTPEEVKYWAASGGVETPIGCGCPGSPHMWSGSFNTPGTYYVVVKQSGNNPAEYKLTVSGKGVSFPTAATAEVQPAAAAAPVAAMAAVASARAGKGPGDALTATGEWSAIQRGEVRWYAFTTDADTKVQVRLSGVPANGVKFSIWSDDNLREWNNTGVDKPVGRGATNKGSGDDLMWTGSFKKGGKHYVKVEQTGPEPAYYLLQIK